MPLNLPNLLNLQIPNTRVHWTKRDTMLYALGVGLGSNPMDEGELPFVYESELKALPTMATVLAYGSSPSAFPDTGVTRSHVVHGEQGLRIHRPLPVEGEFTGSWRVAGVIDKGANRGALIYVDGEIREAGVEAPICTLTSTTYCRSDGGFDGPTGPLRLTYEVPNSAPDTTLDVATFPNAALVYRLSGDYNPLHADPKVAAKAGFKQPILHGRATFGVAGRALLLACCDGQPERLTAMEARFRSPVYPGETLRMEIWNGQNGTVSFRASVPARNVVVLDGGRAEIQRTIG